MSTSALSSRAHRFRAAIVAYIHERRDAKLKGAANPADPAKAARYEPNTWLADAARRVAQIQAVTHVPKVTHPDARGSGLHVAPGALPAHPEVGTHSLDAACADDVVGNAAALDVYKFLKLEVEGRRLLDWLLTDDADLLAALHPDAATARAWAEAFKALRRPPGQWSSQGWTKQIYWCVGDDPADDGQFHLLLPLASSSLMHAIHADIQDARFGEANVAARKAQRTRTPHGDSYRDYRNLVARKLGGSKPQNISQLNSERSGVNYLLDSLPPQWTHTSPRQFLHIESAFKHLRSFGDVGELLRDLSDLLLGRPQPTMVTRLEREAIERRLGEELAAFGASVTGAFPPGWTRDAACKLAPEEQHWLDPERAELPPLSPEDDAFIAEHLAGHWPDQVAHRFGHWLNAYLRDKKLPVGDAEQRHWAKQALIEAAWSVPMQRRSAA